MRLVDGPVVSARTHARGSGIRLVFPCSRATLLLILLSAALCAGGSPAALAAGTVTLEISSPQHARVVAAGGPVFWSIHADVSSSDNLGLALVSVDLVQAESNPQFVELSPAAEVPAQMVGFARPSGISNPDPNQDGAGYGGTPVGPDGHKNLVQIGGSQNTFGEALGDGVGEDAAVDAGIGQGSPQLVAQGQFAAPQQPGVYRLRLRDGIANVLEEVNPPPAFSVVSEAEVLYGRNEIRFRVVRIEMLVPALRLP